MNDVLKGLAQLKKARGDEAPKAQPDPAPSASEPASPASRGEDKTLAGRIPLPLHRRFSRLLLDAADELETKRVYTDEALEAALLVLLENDEARAAWLEKLSDIRTQRR